MGGYARLCLAAYGLTAFVLLCELVGRRRRSEAEARSTARRRIDIAAGDTLMTPRRKRMVTVVAILAGVGIAAAFALQAFQENLLYFYSPTQVAGRRGAGERARSGSAASSRTAASSAQPGSLEVRFTLTDFSRR